MSAEARKDLKSAREWLAEWDAGRDVWSISMGGRGMGNSYENAIQLVTAELIRRFIYAGYKQEDFENPKVESTRKQIYEWADSCKKISDLGISGAVWGSALQLAVKLYINTPAEVMKDQQVIGRHIIVSRDDSHPYGRGVE